MNPRRDPRQGRHRRHGLLQVRRELGQGARGHDRRGGLRGLRGRRHREPAEADRGGVLRRGRTRRRAPPRWPTRSSSSTARSAWCRTTAPPAPTPSATASSRSPAACTTRCWWSASTSRRTAACRARASQITGVRGLPTTPAGWFSLCAAQLLRDLRRRPRGPGEDRGQEPPQRHAGAEVDAEARDHRRGRAQRARSSRGRSASTTAPRSPTAPRRRSSRAASSRRASATTSCWCEAVGDRAVGRTRRSDPTFDFLRWKPTESRGAAGLRAGRHHQPVRRRSTSRRCTTASRSPSCSPTRTSASARRARRRSTSRSGTFELDGELPVNTDGGLKTFGHPDRRHRRAHDLRELQAAAGQGRASAR